MTPALLALAASLLAVAGGATSAAATPARPLLVTVDDLPIGGRFHGEPAERRRITDGLLAALARHKVPAVGFVTWGNVKGKDDEALLESWLNAGHELGDHSDRHLSLTSTDPGDWLADVEAARARLASFLAARGSRLRFFRFPFLREGDTRPKLEAARSWLERTGQRNLTVTIDDQDWSFEEPWVAARRADDAAAMERITDDYLAALRIMVGHHEANGDRLLGRVTPQVLLLHANEVGAANWDRLFTWLEQGHRFASADEVLADPVFADLPSTVATNGFSLWDRLEVVRREKEASDSVTALLQAQAAAWSRGEIEAFCSVYAEDTAFVSPSGLTRGRVEVLERYRKRYRDREAMGALTLEVLELRPAWGVEVSLLGDAVPGRVQSVSVVARWTIRRGGQPDASGLTLIVLRPRGKGWEIVQDASM